MPRTKVVFLHGAGRSGTDAWPTIVADQSDTGWAFLERVDGRDDPRRDADRILDTIASSTGHVVAQSYGAMAALIASSEAAGSVSSLLLCEPACVSVARGQPAVEAHVRSLKPLYASAGDRSVSDEEFARRFTGSFISEHGAPTIAVPREVLRAQGRRLRANVPPWEIEVPLHVIKDVPTLVVTGGRDDMFGEISSALVAAGAEELIVPGQGHRPQDAPDALTWMTAFWTTHAPPP